MIILYAFLLGALALYSYALVDPNITLVNNGAWTEFRNIMVQLGYYQRPTSTLIYGVIVVLLSVFHIKLVERFKKVSPMKIAVIAALAGLLAYPFASHDLFNYIFDAKIFTYYHQNPYLHTALDFPNDNMTRFMHWTHRTYPYGPSFLVLTVVPSFFSFGKFILAYGLFKMLIVGSYMAAVYYLNKWNKEWAMFFATQPLVIIDGLINAHNDIIAISLGIIGLYFVFHRTDMKGRIALVISGLIKYSTVPLIFATKKREDLGTKIAFAGIAVVMIYLTVGRTVQPWYFLTPLVLIPYLYKEIKRFYLFYFFVTVSYIGFVYTGTWNNTFMYSILLVPLGINAAYILYAKRHRK